jgi:hypothetical protein
MGKSRMGGDGDDGRISLISTRECVLDSEMNWQLPPHSQFEALVLERKLLLAGKIVPDAGVSKEHIVARLKQIEQELQRCPKERLAE